MREDLLEGAIQQGASIRPTLTDHPDENAEVLKC